MKRYKHGLSNYRLVSCNMGELIPVMVTETLPGDSIQQMTSVLLRASPLLAPVMHPVQVRIHHWFVPNRLVWDGWEDFITGADFAAPATFPTITHSGTAKTLPDYMGVPNVASLELSALPIRAANLIFNEWYRDQDIVTAVAEDSLAVQKIAWGKDYFTTARPWSQKGDPVVIPLGSTAPVVTTGTTIDIDSGDGNAKTWQLNAAGATAWSGAGGTGSAQFHANFDALETDLSAATGADVNDIRRAFAIQRYQEARARYGSRYSEYLRYLGIRSSDARLQRPEYLGGGRQTIQFSEVLQTAEGTAPVGALKGHGIAGARSRRYRRFFEEHGHIISMMSVRPKGIYSNALERKWSRRFKEDFWQKELETIGQQEVLSKEIYAETGAPGDVVFGFADRYREYREQPSYVCGDFRDATLNFWHMSRDFASAPTLNASFIECNPSKRIFAAQSDDVLWCFVHNSIQARRLVNRSAHARII